MRDIGTFEDTFLNEDSSVLDAIRIIDKTSLQIALVVDNDRKLLGTITDGDIRRGILNGVSLEETIEKIMNVSPHTVSDRASDEEIRNVMLEYKIRQIPVLNDKGQITGLVQQSSLLKKTEITNHQDIDDVSVVLMAGGRGARLSPLTQKTPKPMLEVGGAPLLETIIRWFVGQGFKTFFLSVNYKAEVIESYFGDGSSFGAHITYLHEDEPLGTAGALGLLPEKPKGPLIVMNGDILTNSNFHHLIEFHRQNKACATMCVREYQQQVPYGIVKTSGAKLESITEKPSQSYFVNAGIYVINPEALDCVPSGTFFDMPQLFGALQDAGKESCVFPIREYWRDIGNHEDFEQAQTEYQNIFVVGG